MDKRRRNWKGLPANATDQERVRHIAKLVKEAKPEQYWGFDAAAISWANSGDNSMLATRLRSGDQLSPELRSLIADTIEGKVRRKRSRPRSAAVRAEEYRRALMVLLLEEDGWDKRDAAVAETAQALHCSEGGVRQALAKHEGGLCEAREEVDLLVKQCDLLFGPGSLRECIRSSGMSESKFLACIGWASSMALDSVAKQLGGYDVLRQRVLAGDQGIADLLMNATKDALDPALTKEVDTYLKSD